MVFGNVVPDAAEFTLDGDALVVVRSRLERVPRRAALGVGIVMVILRKLASWADMFSG